MTDLFGAFTAAKERPTMLIDIDGTIGFSIPSLVASLNARFGVDLLVTDWTRYNFQTSLTPEQSEWVNRQHLSKTFHLNLTPDWHGIDAVNTLFTAGFYVVIATNRDPVLTGVTETWLDQWGVKRSLTLVGPTTKVDYCKAHPNTVAVDDDPAKIALLPPLGVPLWMPRRAYTPSWAESAKDVHVFDDWATVLASVGVQ